ncbi:MAG: (2Fe-2S) ferredoxin domain-containing protein [Candidatus Hydrogenedentota bacterium]
MNTRILCDSMCVVVCIDGDCKANGARKLYKKLDKRIKNSALKRLVRLSTCECVGACGKGPHVFVYPGGTWYYQVKPKDAAEIAAALERT